MENDVLKNRIAPWQEKGRWYHGVFERTGEKLNSDKTDSYLLDSTRFGLVNANSIYSLRSKKSEISFIDIVLRPFLKTTTSAFSGTGARTWYTDGTSAISICPNTIASGESCEFWVFIFEK